jgi:hypothetical protein
MTPYIESSSHPVTEILRARRLPSSLPVSRVRPLHHPQSSLVSASAASRPVCTKRDRRTTGACSGLGVLVSFGTLSIVSPPCYSACLTAWPRNVVLLQSKSEHQVAWKPLKTSECPGNTPRHASFILVVKLVACEELLGSVVSNSVRIQAVPCMTSCSRR